MGDFLVFRRMLLPVMIQLIFWLAVLGSIALGVAIMFDQVPDPRVNEQLKFAADNYAFLTQYGINLDTLKAIVGLTFCLIGPIFIRLLCELLILPFRINGTLTDIRNSLLEAAEREPKVAERPVPAAPRAVPPRPRP
jgi:hypothetical protein